MKKSVVLVIAVIYAFAIVIVGFLGIRMRIYNEIVYIDSITCVSDNYKAYPEVHDGLAGHIDVKINKGETVSVLVKCEYSPNNANEFEKGHPFDYIYQKKDSEYVLTVQGDGTCIVKFLKESTCDITVKATDARKAEIKIRVQAVPNDLCEKYGYC